MTLSRFFHAVVVPLARSLRPRRAIGSVLMLIAGLSMPQAGTAQARPDTIALEPIVVTATRLPTPLRAVPAAVTVLEGEALRANGVRQVADALRSVPGLSVTRTGSPGSLTSMFVRGAESDHVQVLIDGVPVNDPGGAVDLANLSTADVERIEIVRGPASVLYGTDAAAGVIQIFTRRGTGPTRLETTLGGSRSRRPGPAAGASNGFEAAATLSGGGRAGEWAVTAARSGSGGLYAVNNRFDNSTITGRVRLQPSEATSLALSLRSGDGRFHFPTDGAGALVDGNQYRRSESRVAGLEAAHIFGPGLELRASVASHDARYTIDDAPDGPADTIGFFASNIRDDLHRRRIDVHANIRAGRSVLTLGAAGERQRAENDTDSRSSFGPYEAGSENERSSRAGYVQIVTAPRPGLAFTGGTRFESSSRYGTLATWRVGLNLNGNSGGIRLSAGSGFKEPTFYENFATGFVRGNPDLEPERTRSAELGFERTLAGGEVRLEAAAFLQQFRNLIQYTAEPGTAGASNYFNVGEARAAGLELGAGMDIGTEIDLDLALTLLRTKVTDAGFGADHAFLQGQPLLRRPGLEADLRTHWTPAAGRFSLGIALTGRRDDLDFADPTNYAGTRVTLPAHTRVDLGFDRTVAQSPGGRQVTLQLRVDNALNRRYEEIRNFPAPRRTISLNVTATTGL